MSISAFYVSNGISDSSSTHENGKRAICVHWQGIPVSEIWWSDYIKDGNRLGIAARAMSRRARLPQGEGALLDNDAAQQREDVDDPSVGHGFEGRWFVLVEAPDTMLALNPDGSAKNRAQTNKIVKVLPYSYSLVQYWKSPMASQSTLRPIAPVAKNEEEEPAAKKARTEDGESNPPSCSAATPPISAKPGADLEGVDLESAPDRGVGHTAHSWPKSAIEDHARQMLEMRRVIDQKSTLLEEYGRQIFEMGQTIMQLQQHVESECQRQSKLDERLRVLLQMVGTLQKATLQGGSIQQAALWQQSALHQAALHQATQNQVTLQAAQSIQQGMVPLLPPTASLLNAVGSQAQNQ